MFVLTKERVPETRITDDFAIYWMSTMGLNNWELSFNCQREIFSYLVYRWHPTCLVQTRELNRETWEVNPDVSGSRAHDILFMLLCNDCMYNKKIRNKYEENTKNGSKKWKLMSRCQQAPGLRRSLVPTVILLNRCWLLSLPRMPGSSTWWVGRVVDTVFRRAQHG